MKFDLYIQDLLYHHDCVIVPELGGFIANYQPATFNPSLQIFYPPTKKVAFNSELKENDGLLAKYISTHEGCSYDEAVNRIIEFVSEIHQTLKANKAVEINNVGVLRYNKNRNIEFTPGKEANFLLSSFGLSTVQAPAIRRTAPHKPLSKKEDSAILVDAKTTKVRTLNQPWRILEVLPVAALLFYIILFPGSTTNINNALSKLIPDINIDLSDYFNNQTTVAIEPEPEIESDYASSGVYVDDKSNKGLILPEDITEETNEEPKAENTIDISELTKEMDQPESEDKEEIEKGIIASKDETILEEDVEPLAKTPKPEKEDPKPVSIKSVPVVKGITATEKYHIIGGAFGVKSNADRFLNELKTYGYKAQIIGVNKRGLYMVSAHSTNSKNDMLAELSRIKKVLSDNAWVFTN